jgi:hypothetical protein
MLLKRDCVYIGGLNRPKEFKVFMRLIVILVLCCLNAAVQAENAPPYNQPKIKLSKVITDIPKSFLGTFEYSFREEAWPGWAALLGTTAILYHYDPDIYQGTRNTGQRWDIGSDDHMKTAINAFGIDILRVPSDSGSLMYFLGDGWVHVMTGVGFFATGYFTDWARPYNTGVEIIHGLAVATIFDQGLKRAFGRESPNRSTSPRGEFRPFPSIPGYQRNTSRYDAMPSGHIMTAALMFTVINQNYWEYWPYLVPFEGLYLGALGFEMVNNGVHWASDYPLGIAVGYVVGKVASNMGVEKTDLSRKNKKPDHWAFFPVMGPNGPELTALYSF